MRHAYGLKNHGDQMEPHDSALMGQRAAKHCRLARRISPGALNQPPAVYSLLTMPVETENQIPSGRPVRPPAALKPQGSLCKPPAASSRTSSTTLPTAGCAPALRFSASAPTQAVPPDPQASSRHWPRRRHPQAPHRNRNRGLRRRCPRPGLSLPRPGRCHFRSEGQRPGRGRERPGRGHRRRRPRFSVSMRCLWCLRRGQCRERRLWVRRQRPA